MELMTILNKLDVDDLLLLMKKLNKNELFFVIIKN